MLLLYHHLLLLVVVVVGERVASVLLLVVLVVGSEREALLVGTPCLCSVGRCTTSLLRLGSRRRGVKHDCLEEGRRSERPLSVLRQ